MVRDSDQGLLSPGEAARILGVSPKTVNRWADDGRIRCIVTLGGHRRFRRDVIEAVAASMGLDSTDEPEAPAKRSAGKR